MSIKEANQIIDLVRKSNVRELALVLLILTPIYLVIWILFINQLNPNISIENKYIILSIAEILFLGSIVLMKFYERKEFKKQYMADQIESYLKRKGWSKISYERLNKNLGFNISDDEIDNLINDFPNQFTKGRVKGGKSALFMSKEEELENK